VAAGVEIQPTRLGSLVIQALWFNIDGHCALKAIAVASMTRAMRQVNTISFVQ
jgi:hypothetical protein